MNQFQRFTTFAFAGLAMMFALNACGSAPTVKTTEEFEVEQLSKTLAVEATTFAGKVAGTNAYIAIVERGGVVQAYICDGTQTSVTLAKWFDGTLQNNQLTAANEDGSSLTGTVTGKTLSGTVVIAGVERSFSAAETEDPFGLWIANGNPIQNGELKPLEEIALFGWIKLPDGTQRGAVSNKVGEEVTAELGNPDSVNTGGTKPMNPDAQDGGLGLCAMYQNLFKNASASLKRGVRDVTQRNRIQGLRDRALMMYNAECKERFGPITGPDLPDDAQ